MFTKRVHRVHRLAPVMVWREVPVEGVTQLDFCEHRVETRAIQCTCDTVVKVLKHSGDTLFAENVEHKATDDNNDGRRMPRTKVRISIL